MLKRQLVGAFAWWLIFNTTAAAEGLTPEAALATARIVEHSSLSSGMRSFASISPDESRYLIRLVRGDVSAGVVTLELWSGMLNSLESATPRRVATLATRGLGGGKGGARGTHGNLDDYTNPIKWIDNSTVAFLWENQVGITQAITLNLTSDRIRYLTGHPTPVRQFAVTPHGVLYAAVEQYDRATADEMLRKGFVVGESADLLALLSGDVDNRNIQDQWRNTQWFFAREGGAGERIELCGRSADPQDWQNVLVSQNGKIALISTAPQSFPEEWARYGHPNEGLNRILQRNLSAAVRGPSIYRRFFSRWCLLDLYHRTSRPLWGAMQAPDEQARLSPDGLNLLLLDAYTPVNSSTQNFPHAAVIVTLQNGGFDVPNMAALGAVIDGRWLGEDEAELRVREDSGSDRDARVMVRRNRDGAWLAMPAGDWKELRETGTITLELAQGINDPPNVFARDNATGERRLVLDPNPNLLGKYSIGLAQSIQGTLESGEVWRGTLFFPPSYEPNRRYPLVIQSVYGSGRSVFSLYDNGVGVGLGPSNFAVNVGRLLAAKDIIVLTLTAPVSAVWATSGEAQLYMRSFESAVETLHARGIVDPNRVGLIGFSRNGFWVEHTLAHSDTSFAAAVIADNWDPSYASTAMSGWDSEATLLHGGPAFGEGLEGWLEQAPGFNVQRVRTPLRMISQSDGGLRSLVFRWEFYSRLRFLESPVELYVMPNIEHGAHNTQNPGQILAVQHGVIDWFNFWLNSSEDPDPRKSEQYARWRTLRERRDALETRPRPPLLDWHAEARSSP